MEIALIIYILTLRHMFEVLYPLKIYIAAHHSAILLSKNIFSP